MELAVLYKSFSDIVKTYHKVHRQVGGVHSLVQKLSHLHTKHHQDLSKNLVPDPTLTYEIKKYSRSFD
jgi:iron-sulfur cluster repair protein YtfE (RIC family)